MSKVGWGVTRQKISSVLIGYGECENTGASLFISYGEVAIIKLAHCVLTCNDKHQLRSQLLP